MVRGGRDPSGARVDVHIVDGVVRDRSSIAAVDAVDATGLVVAPGFVDLQVNGACGVDITATPEGIWAVSRALPRFGVTGFLPTVVTSTPDVARRALATLAAGPPDGWRGARPLGLHFEGPMIAPARVGAHDPMLIAPPAIEVIADWSRDAGVALVTLAPELPGALPVIAELVRRGIVVAAGHTDADADQARAAVDAGLSAVTHLFNAMAPIHHRRPMLAGAVLGDLPVVAGLIADGVHLAPEILTFAWRQLGPDRRVLVSDAVAGLGTEPGRQPLGGQSIVSDGRASRTVTGTLAGGLAGLDECVRTVVATTGCAPVEAIHAVTATPAALLGRADLGRLGSGSAGDVVLLDDGLNVVATIVAGIVVYRRADG